MKAVLSLAVILIVACVIAVVFVIMMFAGKEVAPAQNTEAGEIDPTDYSDMEDEYYR